MHYSIYDYDHDYDVGLPCVAVGLDAWAWLDQYPVGVISSAQSPLIRPPLKLHLECFFVRQLVVLVDRRQVHTCAANRSHFTPTAIGL